MMKQASAFGARKARFNVQTALRDAGFWTLIGLGMFGPMMGLKIDETMSGHTVLRARPGLLVGALLVIFVGRLLLCWRASTNAPKPARATPSLLQRCEPAVQPVMIAGMAIFPVASLLIAGPAGSLKWVDNFGIQILIYIMLGWGLNVVVGLAGLLDLGYVAFYAIGSYTYALLAQDFGFSFWLALPVAGALAAFLGILLGFPVLRLRGDYLALVTLAFGEIIYLVAQNWTSLTGGSAGISVPKIDFFGIPFNATPHGFAAHFGLGFSPVQRTIFLYYVIFLLALLAAFVTLRLKRLPIGRAWEALREDEIAAKSLGINATNTKLTAFAIGATFGGLAGAFFGARQGYVSPESFRFIESALILSIVVLGGMGSLLGVVLAAIVLVGGSELLRGFEFLVPIIGDDPVKYRLLLVGLGMVVMMLWRPRGLIATREPTVFLKQKKTVSGSFVKEGHG
ncbi:high-affinity branched-chain amino acid ABC transporter permease LivM [Burkholderia sp. JPY164]|uniref:High-affinity branched-chain amino acid ABC transporter permease LivM n=2 Tax=Paraburkholderia guartelaensis TaxID=2546446 RepID=A0ABU9S5Y3_9BURK